MTKVLVILAALTCLIALQLAAVRGEGLAHASHKPGHGNRRGRHALLALERDERELAQLKDAHWRAIASHGEGARVPMKSKRDLEHDAELSLEHKQSRVQRKQSRFDAHAKLPKKQQQQQQKQHKKSSRKAKTISKESREQQRQSKQLQIQQKHQRKSQKHHQRQHNQAHKQQQQQQQQRQQQQQQRQLQRHKRQRHHF